MEVLAVMPLTRRTMLALLGSLAPRTAFSAGYPDRPIKLVVALAAGESHSVALKSNGTVWAWGLNNYGQIGDGTTTTRFTPVQVTALTGIIAISAGEYFTLALKSDGTFQVSLTKSHRVDVWGKYTATGDTMTIQEAHGSHTPKSCRGQATYKFTRNGDMLMFTKVSDKCKLREKNILAGWKPWKGK